MGRTVLLRHFDLPEGPAAEHFDWLIERPGSSEQLLMAFRVRVRVDSPDCQRFGAERMADHRRVYLDFEGPLTGGRGRVEKMAEGTCEVMEAPGRIEIRLTFGGVERGWKGVEGAEKAWTFEEIEGEISRK